MISAAVPARRRLDRTLKRLSGPRNGAMIPTPGLWLWMDRTNLPAVGRSRQTLAKGALARRTDLSILFRRLIRRAQAARVHPIDLDGRPLGRGHGI